MLFRLLDEAEEQECREAILAFFFLWHHAPDNGWSRAELECAVEGCLAQLVNLKVDFKIGDPLAKLEKLRVIEKQDDRYRAQPIAKALTLLDGTWGSYFKCGGGK